MAMACVIPFFNKPYAYTKSLDGEKITNIRLADDTVLLAFAKLKKLKNAAWSCMLKVEKS